ncbi:MAG TPA: hypothetical protein VNJ53_06265 [Gaiellaceae bacterium]|nr:hypothetical protein [Gaiellaceae bacterium]
MESQRDALAVAQLALLRTMAALDPAPFVMGGYAEDALLAGSVTRPHADVDWLVPRAELELRLEQAAGLGFEGFETWGEAAPGVPFYLSADRGDLRLEIGVLDELAGEHWICVHKLFFEVDGTEPPAGYRVLMPPDTFAHPRARLDGIAIPVVSPLALYQLRAGIAHMGSFGPLSDRQRGTLELLRARFFPERAESDLLPRIEPLADD